MQENERENKQIPKFAKRKKIFEVKTFSENYRRFRKSKLGILDSFFNSLYISLCVKNEKNEKNSESETKLSDFSFGLRFFTKAPFYVRNTFAGIKDAFLSAFRRDGGTKKYKKRRDVLKLNYHKFIISGVVLFALIYFAVILNKPIVMYAQIDGVTIGIVSDETVMQSAVNELESNVGGILGGDFKFPYKVTYTFKRQWDANISEKTELVSNLYPYVRDYITSASGIYIDGILVAVCQTEDEINDVTEELIHEKYLETRDSSTRILNDVEVINQAYPTKSVITRDKLETLLRELMILPSERENYQSPVSNLNTEQKDTSVSYGQTQISGLANDVEFRSEKKIKKSNVPQSTSGIHLRFCTTKSITYTQDIPFNTMYVENRELYTSMADITQVGSIGQKTVNATLFFENGEEVKRTIDSQSMIKEPVTQIVSVGTKVLPEDLLVTGYMNRFILPHIGIITSKYGMREDGNHFGWDMAGREGENIYAAASGTVVTSFGTESRETIFEGRSYSGYGNVVVIYHGNNYYTLYAHMLDVAVKVGQEVKQGEIIGYIGNTGRSEGNHVHFEILLGTKKLDPGDGYLYGGEWTIYDYRESKDEYVSDD